jgi:YD repeat-containing protein
VRVAVKDHAARRGEEVVLHRRDLLLRMLAAGAAGVGLPVPAGAETATYTYDAIGRLASVTFNDGRVVQYSYDATGNRSSVVRTAGSTTPFTATIAITDTGPAVLRALAEQNGYDGRRNATITFQVANGVTVTGFPGQSGIDTGLWPAGFSTTLSLLISGNVFGGGGIGGAGGVGPTPPPNGSPGGVGGDAIYCRVPIGIAVQTGGAVRAGGGGGGGGYGGIVSSPWDTIYTGGGGGGGGQPNGAGGAGGQGDQSANGEPGGTGTISAVGVGGAGSTGARAGRNGGAFGQPGQAASNSAGPGASGYAVRKNGNTVPVTNNGTIVGTIG